MKNLIAGLMAVFVINSVVAGGYKDDNVRWLVYDMKTKDKTLMDIRMETFLKGQATFTGPMNRIGRRKAESGKSRHYYVVTIRSGVMTILDDMGSTIMWGEVDKNRGEIKGEFSEEYGGGSWVASMQGPTGAPMELYQYCVPTHAGSNLYDKPHEWSCQNVGMRELCAVGWYSAPVGSFNKEGCLEVAQQHCETTEWPFTDYVWNDAMKKCEEE